MKLLGARLRIDFAHVNAAFLSGLSWWTGFEADFLLSWLPMRGDRGDLEVLTIDWARYWLRRRP